MALMLMLTVMFCVAYLISDIVYALAQPAHPVRGRKE
jgi:ABC-type dipeptide/oligopeptide/nickel transport system permease component